MQYRILSVSAVCTKRNEFLPSANKQCKAHREKLNVNYVCVTACIMLCQKQHKARIKTKIRSFATTANGTKLKNKQKGARIKFFIESGMSLHIYERMNVIINAFANF